jgi:ribosomal protein S18 acetylase RimI-like enzyme
MSADVVLREATSAEDLADVRTLFVEYARSLGFNLGFQDFDGELAGLPGAYAPPRGRLILAARAGVAAACVAVRPLAEDGVAEMKRLYVRPAHRGRGIGVRLAREAVVAAAALGYTRMRLDTLGSMTAAMALYRSLGFVEIPAYYANPLPDVHYFELDPRASG